MSLDNIESVNQRINEKKAEREKLVNEKNEIIRTIHESYEMYAIGSITESEMKQANELKQSKDNAIEEVDEVIAALEKVKKKFAMDFMPFAKRNREAKQKDIQKKVDAAIKAAKQARKLYIEALAKINEEYSKVGVADTEIRNVARNAGIDENFVSGVHVPIVISGGYTSEADSLGIEERHQKNAVKHGTIPKWMQ